MIRGFTLYGFVWIPFPGPRHGQCLAVGVGHQTEEGRRGAGVIVKFGEQGVECVDPKRRQ